MNVSKSVTNVSKSVTNVSKSVMNVSKYLTNQSWSTAKSRSGDNLLTVSYNLRPWGNRLPSKSHSDDTTWAMQINWTLHTLKLNGETLNEVKLCTWNIFLGIYVY